jgi:hypothetical protein
MLTLSFQGTDGVVPTLVPTLGGVQVNPMPVLSGVQINPMPVLSGVQIDPTYVLRGYGFGAIDAATYYTTEGGEIWANDTTSATQKAFESLQTAINAAAAVIGGITGMPVKVDGKIGRATAVAAREILWSITAPEAADANSVLGKLNTVAHATTAAGQPNDFALIQALATDADSLTGMFTEIAAKKYAMKIATGEPAPSTGGSKKSWSMTTKVAVASGGVLAAGLLIWGATSMLKSKKHGGVAGFFGFGRPRRHRSRKHLGCNCY